MPLIEIYEDRISKQKHFLSPNPFLKRKKYISFSEIKSIELRKDKDLSHSKKPPYLNIFIHNNEHVKIELIDDSIISDVKKILKENFKDFHDLSDESKN